MKSWLASMLAGEFSLGSAMTDTKALQEKCKIMSCRYLIASTYLRRVAIFQFGLHTRFPSTSSLRPFTKKMMVHNHFDDQIMSKLSIRSTSWPNCQVAHKIVKWRIKWSIKWCIDFDIPLIYPPCLAYPHSDGQDV